MHSHIGDAYGYLLLGGGEHRRLVQGQHNKNFTKVNIAKCDFDVF